MHYMPNTKAENYQQALNFLNSVYKRGGFDWTKIRCDNEFQAALDPIMATYDPPITVSHANIQEHVLQAERNNKYIKEHFRAAYHRFTLERLPREMVKYLRLKLARKPNMFPAKHGASNYCRLCMIVCQENVDYEKHLKIPFSTYVLDNNEPKPTNSNAPRRLDCIYLRATDSAEVGDVLLH